MMAELPIAGKECIGKLIILGLTREGKRFRPSDWAERLCSAISCFRPVAQGEANAHLKYSPYVHPAMVNGVKAVVVTHALKSIEPLAHHFLVDFATDNDLQMVEACHLQSPDEKNA